MIRICRNVYIILHSHTYISYIYTLIYNIILRHKLPCTSARTSTILLADESRVNTCPTYQLNRNETPKHPPCHKYLEQELIHAWALFVLLTPFREMIIVTKIWGAHVSEHYRNLAGHRNPIYRPGITGRGPTTSVYLLVKPDNKRNNNYKAPSSCASSSMSSS